MLGWCMVSKVVYGILFETGRRACHHLPISYFATVQMNRKSRERTDLLQHTGPAAPIDVLGTKEVRGAVDSIPSSLVPG